MSAHDLGLTPNTAFQDYATSGAFQITLTSNQVSCLSMGHYDERLAYGSSALQSLMRKGLLEKVAANPDDFHGDDLRPTFAGLLVARLCQLAGLTNAEADPLQEEFADLRAKLVEARTAIATAQEDVKQAWADNRSLITRLQAGQRDLAQEIARRDGGEVPLEVLIVLRDKQPDRSIDEMAEFSGLAP